MPPLTRKFFLCQPASARVPHRVQVFTFTTQLGFIDMGRMTLRVIPVPEEVSAELPTGRPRVCLRVDGREPELRRALLRHPEYGPHIIMGAAQLRALGLGRSSSFTVALTLDPEPDQVNLPPELQAALAAHPTARERWNQLTPGAQRGLAYTVQAAKRAETRQRRATELVHGIASGPFALLPGRSTHKP